VHRLLCPTETALHLATPVERTRTSLYDGYLIGPVTPSTAHQVAAIHSYRRVVALTAVRSRYPEPRVALAESRRRFIVNQVLCSRRLVVWVVRLKLEGVAVPFAPSTPTALPSQAARVAHHDSGSAVKAVLQVVTDDSEAGQPHPTGLHRARTGHSVTFALLPHLGGDVLKQVAVAVAVAVAVGVRPNLAVMEEAFDVWRNLQLHLIFQH